MSIELKGALFAGLDKYLSKFLEIYRAKTGLVELKNLLKSLDSDVSMLKSHLLLICPLIYKIYHCCWIVEKGIAGKIPDLFNLLFTCFFSLSDWMNRV